MRKKPFYLFIIYLIFIQNIIAQFPQDIQYQTIVSETPELPNYLESVEDTSVPEAITITRITDYVAAWDWYPKLEYAKIQPWNADASIIKYYSVAIYDAETHQIIKQLPGGQIYPSYWSNTNSDLIYGFKENGQIRTYSISNDEVQTINTDIQGYDIVKLGPGEGNIDKNDHYVVLVGKSGVNMDVIVFDLQENQIVHTETFEGAWGNDDGYPEYVDWVSVSQSGDYVGIMWNHNTTSEDNPFNGHFGVEIYNTTDMEYLRRIAVYGNHGDFGFAADGDEVFVQFWGETGTINMYYLDRMERVVITNHSDFSGGGHISCRNLNRPGWAYAVQKESPGQIVALKLDNSGLVEHFGHHYSSSANYNKSPMSVPNRNGDRVMSKSDFGNAENADLVYCFESTMSNALSVENTEDNIINMYPNPTNSMINIKGKNAISQVSIYNKIGLLMKAYPVAKLQSIQIDLKNFEKGLYLFKILDSSGQTTSRIIIKK